MKFKIARAWATSKSHRLMRRTEQLCRNARHLPCMIRRATLLIVEPEPRQAISARKLVMETAKFNVITAYSGEEAIELLEKYPKVDAVIVHSEIPDLPPSSVFQDVKKLDPDKPTILLVSGVARSRKNADHIIASDEPEELLQLTRELFGDPRQATL